LKRERKPVDVLWCPNARQHRRNGWKYPPAVAKQLRADFAGKRILQLFGGRSEFGLRLDIDPIVRPDVIGDAWLPPFGRDSFDVVIMDPPYLHINAQEKTALFRAAGWIARERIVWFSTVWQAATGGVALEKSWLVRVGDSCHVRCLQYFKVIAKPGPVLHFTRGRAMKYNRWIAQPAMLPFSQSPEAAPGIR